MQNYNNSSEKENLGKKIVLEFLDFLRYKVENDKLTIEETESLAKCFLENTLVHELRHLADGIAQSLGIELEGEPVAYLSGDTAMELADIVCKLGCDECRK